MTVRRRWSLLASLWAVAAMTAAVLTGCSSSAVGRDHSHAGDGATAAGGTPAGGSATVKNLTISDAIVPVPASPDVAAAYFTVTNHGNLADQLISVASDLSPDTSLHTYKGSKMVALTALDVPAAGSARLAVGSNHVMIMSPTRAVQAGQTVHLTLTFAQAGPVDVPALVVDGTGPQDGMDMGGS